MPRYFFHTRIGDDLVEDSDGTELRDPDRAWEVERDTIQAAMTEPANQARLIGACLVVTDESGDVVLEFPFAEAMLSGSENGRLH